MRQLHARSQRHLPEMRYLRQHYGVQLTQLIEHQQCVRTSKGGYGPPFGFVATGGGQANYSAGNTTSTPFFFRRITMNFAGSVVLALRPTVCTSSGPS